MKYLTNAFLLLLLSISLLNSCTKERQLVVACISLPSDSIFVNEEIQFVNCSQFAEEYKWYYSLNSEIIDSSSLASPTFTFEQIGAYDITLKASAAPEGRDSTFTKLYVLEQPEEE